MRSMWSRTHGSGTLWPGTRRPSGRTVPRGDRPATGPAAPDATGGIAAAAGPFLLDIFLEAPDTGHFGGTPSQESKTLHKRA